MNVRYRYEELWVPVPAREGDSSTRVESIDVPDELAERWLRLFPQWQDATDELDALIYRERNDL